MHSYESKHLGDIPYQSLMRVRSNHRAADMAESQLLLLELGTCEPTLQQCFKAIESTCLSQGIVCQINGRDCSARFQGHLDVHHISFLGESIRAVLMYGFVPWRLRKLSVGDTIAEVLPPGTFDWQTEVGPSQDSREWSSRKRLGPKDVNNDTRLVVYRVQPTAGDFREEDVHIYMYVVPGLNLNSKILLFHHCLNFVLISSLCGP